MQWTRPAVRTAVALCLAATIFIPATCASAVTWGANYFPNITLTTQEGKEVHLWDDLLKDRNVVINFIYTQCGASCPLETARLAQVQQLLGDRMGRDVFFYSFSIDPERDTPAELKAYAERFHAGRGWLFLTGRKADIELVRGKLGQAARAGQNQLADHSTTLMIGNAATGQWMRDSSTDDPRYIASMVGDWLSSWRGRQPGKSYAEAPPLADAADRGAYLFRTRCAACHTVGRGDGLGPDLSGVTAARDHAWLARYVAAPDEVLASGDPVANALFEKYRQVRMPNLRLGEKDVEALLSFLKARSVSSHASETAETRAPAAAAFDKAGRIGDGRKSRE